MNGVGVVRVMLYPVVLLFFSEGGRAGWTGR